MLREGGNAVDAAVCAVLTSFVVESPLTGLGAGGFMLVHTADEDVLLDFFVEVPGRGGAEFGAELVPVPVQFDETPQVFNVGAASCGVPGTPAGLADALRRFGSMPMAELIRPAVAHARDGVRINTQQAYLLEILDPILTRSAEGRAVYAPEGRILRAGDAFRFGDLAAALERYGAEGPEPFYCGDIAQRIAEWVTERGGVLGADDLAAYAPVAREPVRAAFRGREIHTNPPPSAGGILIALCLDLLERLGSDGVEDVVATMHEANQARTEEFHAGLYDPAFTESFSLLTASVGSPSGFARGSARVRGARPADRSAPRRTSPRSTGRALRGGHVLERHRLGTGGARNRRARQQHARRAGPEPARLPRPSTRPPDAVDDGPDRGAARRRARGRARERRVEPDPVRDPSGGPADDRGRDAGPGRGRRGPRPFRRRRRPRGAGRRPGGLAPGSRAGCRSCDGGGGTCSSGASTRWLATPTPASYAAEATRGGEERWWCRRPRLLPAGEGAVSLCRLGDLLRSADRFGDRAQRPLEQAHALVLGSQLEQPLLGVGGELDPPGELVRALIAELLGLLFVGDLLEELGERRSRATRRGDVVWLGLVLDVDQLDLPDRELAGIGAVEDPERGLSRNQHVHAAVVESLEHVRDLGGAADAPRGPALVAEHDPERLTAVQRVADHSLVAVLEDVKRQQLTGEQHDRQLGSRCDREGELGLVSTPLTELANAVGRAA